MRTAFLTILLAAAFAPSATARESGSGTIGEWRLVWRVSEAQGLFNEFRRVLGDEPVFPLRSAISTSGNRRSVLLLGADGDVEREMGLGRHEEALVSSDGGVVLVWADDPAAPGRREFRFNRRDALEPEWAVTARGTPILLAPDGSVFVVAAARETPDGRPGEKPAGELQVVGASGRILGELPIFPPQAGFTSDLRRICFLHDRELMVLTVEGRVAWRRRVPFDNLTARLGLRQLVSGAGRVFVTGTGAFDPGGSASLHPRRRGLLQAYSDDGELLWQDEQTESEDLWFQVTAATSPDGARLTTCHSTSHDLVVRQYDAATGELLWARPVRRALGFRSLSMSGELTVLAHGSGQTDVVAWDSEGNVVWDGVLFFASRLPRIGAGNLLVAERWIVRLDVRSAGS